MKTKDAVFKFDDKHPEHPNKYFWGNAKDETVIPKGVSMQFRGDEKRRKIDGGITNVEDWELVTFDTEQECTDAQKEFEKSTEKVSF